MHISMNLEQLLQRYLLATMLTCTHSYLYLHAYMHTQTHAYMCTHTHTCMHMPHNTSLPFLYTHSGDSHAFNMLTSPTLMYMHCKTHMNSWGRNIKQNFAARLSYIHIYIHFKKKERKSSTDYHSVYDKTMSGERVRKVRENWLQNQHPVFQSGCDEIYICSSKARKRSSN